MMLMSPVSWDLLCWATSFICMGLLSGPSSEKVQLEIQAPPEQVRCVSQQLISPLGLAFLVVPLAEPIRNRTAFDSFCYQSEQKGTISLAMFFLN